MKKRLLFCKDKKKRWKNSSNSMYNIKSRMTIHGEVTGQDAQTIHQTNLFTTHKFFFYEYPAISTEQVQ